MAALEQVGDKTLADLNQYVHSWLDDAERRLRSLLDDYKITIEAVRKGEGK